MSCKYCGNKGADNCFLNNIPKCWKPAKELEQRISVIEEVNRNNGILIAEKNRKIKELKTEIGELQSDLKESRTHHARLAVEILNMGNKINELERQNKELIEDLCKMYYKPEITLLHKYRG